MGVRRRTFRAEAPEAMVGGVDLERPNESAGDGSPTGAGRKRPVDGGATPPARPPLSAWGLPDISDVPGLAGLADDGDSVDGAATAGGLHTTEADGAGAPPALAQVADALAERVAAIESGSDEPDPAADLEPQDGEPADGTGFRSVAVLAPDVAIEVEAGESDGHADQPPPPQSVGGVTTVEIEDGMVELPTMDDLRAVAADLDEVDTVLDRLDTDGPADDTGGPAGDTVGPADDTAGPAGDIDEELGSTPTHQEPVAEQ